MQTNTRELGFVNFNGQEMNFVKYNSVVVYEAWKKLTESGIPPLTLLNCKQANLADYKIFGESIQEETPNMLDKELSEIIGYYGRYIRDDGTTADGLMWYEITPYTGQIPTSLTWYVTKPLPIEPDTYYMYSGLQDANNPAYMFLEEDMSTIINGKAIKGSATFKTPSNARYIVMSIRTDVVETMKLQELFPTVDKPVEIESVGDKTINLAPGFYYGYPTDSAMEPYKFPVKANTTYSIHFDTSNQAYKTIWLYDNDNNITKLVTYAYAPISYNKMVVIPKQDGYMSVGFYNKSAKVIVAEGLYFTLNATQQNNLNNNGIATSVTSGEIPYEPYGYKIPVKVRGKNIAHPNGKDFNINGIVITTNQDGTVTMSGSATNTQSTILHWCGRKDNANYWHDFILYPGETVKMSIRNAETGEMASFNYTQQWEGVETGVTYYGGIDWAKVNEPVYFSRIYTQHNLTAGENRYAGTWKIQVEISNTVTEYEPFVEPVKTNIYLKEPLRKIGDDTDYIDFGNQKVIRNIKEKVLNGNESWAVYSSTPGMYYTSILNDNIIASSPGLCSHFVWSNPIKDEGQCYVAGKGASFHNFFLRDVNKFPTKDDLIVFLKENNVKFIAVLETPTEETVELPNVPLNKGTNIIEIDTSITPSNMEVTYLGKE